MIPRKELDIPLEVSGRRVTNRGVHLQPHGFHGPLMEDLEYWVELLVSMGMSWVVILTESDSVLHNYGTDTTPIEVLLEAGIIPIIRDKNLLPGPFTNMDAVERTVDIYGRYGLKPPWILYNEPFDEREWANGKVPDYEEAWQIIAERWTQGAHIIAGLGGLVGFPDGPGYEENPFERLKGADGGSLFEEGHAFYAGHHYGKNRPRDYPYDAVTRYGAQLTERAYRRLLDDFADMNSWREESLSEINTRRRELRSQTLTALDDDVCWRGWEQIAQWSLESFGFVVPMAMTEGGWVPRDRPGSGHNTDIRMPLTTPNMVAKRTLQMYDTPSPFFAICPWLLADRDLGGAGWPFDAWHGWAYSNLYGVKKPVITALQKLPPKEVQRRSLPLVIDVDGDTRNWTWVVKKYGARYRRGTSRLQLIEVHEYEGPATFDVWVVDSDGLPVGGVPFYCHASDAPPLEGDEWYEQGWLQTTGADGRLSFSVANATAQPGAGTVALWPKGRGDVLEKLGLLAGTRHRCLRGLWLLAPEGTPPLPEMPPHLFEPGEPEQPGSDVVAGKTTVWEMSVQYRSGPRVIAGSFPNPGISLTVTDPWGNASAVVSGSKTEYGAGGFEVLAPHPVRYTLSFLDERFEVQMREGTTLVTFTQTTLAPPAPPGGAQPEPTGPGSQPGHRPSPVVPQPPAPGSEAGMWEMLLQKLKRIEDLIARLPQS